MEEFLKIDWRIKDVSTELENIKTFITEECVSDSYVYFAESLTKKEVSYNNKLTKKEHIPGISFRKKFHRFSILDKWEQAQCINALKCLQSGKESDRFNKSEQFSIGIYNKLQPKILSENTEFLQFAKNKWETTQSKQTKVKPAALNYAKNYWKTILDRHLDYPQFYKAVNLLPLNYNEDELAVTVALVQNLLEMGTMAKFAIPSLKCRLVLKLSTLPAHDQTRVGSKLPVSQDENIDKLLQNHAIDVVISSSGLKRIMNGTNDNEEWNIPVVIKQKEITQDGKKMLKNIVYIDKPFPKKHPTRTDFNRRCVKLMIKTNLCKYKGFSFPTTSENSETDETCKSANNIIHHNVSYRIWKLNQQAENKLMKSNVVNKEIRLLVRCKTDASEALENGPLQPVIVVPKLEYQLGLGGNIASKSELSAEWTSLFFRPYSKLYRVRTDFTSLEVVLVEPCTLQKINTEAMAHYQFKPHLGLGVLYKLFAELSKLEPGKYLLQHIPKHGPFVSILKECDESTSDCYNLHEEYKNCDHSNNMNLSWCPIDASLILPVHNATNQMPGLFPGKERMKRSQKKGIKKKKKTKGMSQKKKV